MTSSDLHNYNTVHTAVGAPEAKNGALHLGDAPGLDIKPDLGVLGQPVAVRE